MEEVAAPRYIRSIQNHRNAINWIAFSPDSNRLVSASDDKTVMVWSPNERTNICHKYNGHKDAVTSVSMTNSFIVSGSKDCTARLWRLVTDDDNLSHLTDSSIYRCHQSPIRCVDINSEETNFCTSSDDKTIKIWSATATNKCISTFSGVHTNWVRHARYSKLSPFLFGSCGDDGLICIWDTRTKPQNRAAIKLKSRGRSTHYLGIQWHPNCKYIISSGSTDSSIRIWDLRYEKSIQSYQIHEGIVTSTDFHRSGNYLLSSSSDQTCKLLNLYEGRPLFTIRAHTGPVNSVQFSPDGEYFATTGQDHSILYWANNLPNDTLLTDDETEYTEDQSNSTEGRISSCEEDIQSLENRIKRIHLGSKDVSSGQSINNSKVESNYDEAVSINEESTSTINSISNIETPKIEASDLNHEPRINNVESNCISILQCILKQLEVITDSILQIDQRLCTLEDKYQSLS